MKYAVIENNTVTNIAEASVPLGENWIETENAKKGDIWDGEAFTPPAPPAPTAADVNAERDRRLPLDFEFNGKMYQRDAVSIARISGAGALALGAIVQGAQPGNLLWHGRDTPFVWIASDDSLTTMDAQTCFAFGAAAAAVETEIIFAAKALRGLDPIPANFADDEYWP